jgi:hypothetical protein
VLFIFGLFQIVSSNQNPESPMVNQSTPSPTALPSESLLGTPSAAPTSGTAISDGKVTLKLDAVRGNSFIDVIVDGQRVIKGSLFQGDVKNFEGTRAISVYLSNPAGLDVTVDGELLPPLGGQNEEVRRTFR